MNTFQVQLAGTFGWLRKAATMIALLWVPVETLGQGQVYFNNGVFRGGGGATAPVVAPIYGVEPADNTRAITGQPPSGIPAGTTVYNGALLTGTGSTAQLWAGPAGTPETELRLCRILGGGDATTTFGTGARSGFVISFEAVVPDVPSAPGVYATFQVRAWDNQGGTITSWEQVMANASVVPHGASPLFTPPYQLGTPLGQPLNLIGLESFNLYVVPEPSVWALGAVAAGALVLHRLRRR
jgi:hypothetical protein